MYREILTTYKKGSHYKEMGPIEDNFCVYEFSEIIERILLSDGNEALLLPQDTWAIQAVRAYTNEQFSLSRLAFLTHLEDFYFRNLTKKEREMITRCNFKEITLSEYD